MHKVIGYENGRAIWSENTPAFAGNLVIRGSLVVGESEKSKALAAAAKHRDKRRAEKADAA